MPNQIRRPLDSSHTLKQFQSTISHVDRFHAGNDAVLGGDGTHHLVATGTHALSLGTRPQKFQSSLPLRQRLSEVVKQLRTPSCSVRRKLRLKNLSLDWDTELKLANKRFFLQSQPRTQSFKKGVPPFYFLHASFPHHMMVDEGKRREILLRAVGTTKTTTRTLVNRISAKGGCSRIKRIPSQSGFRCFLGCLCRFGNLLLSLVASLLFKVRSIVATSCWFCCIICWFCCSDCRSKPTRRAVWSPSPTVPPPTELPPAVTPPVGEPPA